MQSLPAESRDEEENLGGVKEESKEYAGTLKPNNRPVDLTRSPRNQRRSTLMKALARGHSPRTAKKNNEDDLERVDSMSNKSERAGGNFTKECQSKPSPQAQKPAETSTAEPENNSAKATQPHTNTSKNTKRKDFKITRNSAKMQSTESAHNKVLATYIDDRMKSKETLPSLNNKSSNESRTLQSVSKLSIYRPTKFDPSNIYQVYTSRMVVKQYGSVLVKNKHCDSGRANKGSFVKKKAL
eukprot:TRINITY_DN2491_c0_g2_i6.p1 TRINITY_DN2491_c0_g2~~TRINITY_DN2491_c0_g2_i6.p1  ORF type:complete len:241 (-),score=37.45 TRINITY_DN2491_c0_g2_i6:86-808(-)